MRQALNHLDFARVEVWECGGVGVWEWGGRGLGEGGEGDRVTGVVG